MEASYLLIAGAAVTAVAAVQQGRAAAAAESLRQKDLEQQMAMQRTQTLDQELQKRREIGGLIGEQMALGAQRGFDPFSIGSSFLAIQQETEAVGQRDVDAIRLIGAGRMAELSEAKLQSKLAGSAAKKTGYIKATGAILAGAAGYAEASTPPPGKTWLSGTPRKLS